MEYGFTLNWLDLPEELREQKITEYLEFHCYLKEKIADPRSRAEESIKAHFPIYF